MTSAGTWIAAAEARAGKRAKEGRVDIGTFTGNMKADDVIFSRIVEPSGRPAFDDAVQIIRAVQRAGFVLPQSGAASEFTKSWQDAATRVLQGAQSAAEALRRAQGEAQ